MRVGVDNGGTWIRLVGLDAQDRRVWTLKKPSPTVEQLPNFLKKHLRRFKGRLDALAVGSRGVWKPSKHKAVKRALQGLAKKIVVMSDVEAAWLAAYGRTSFKSQVSSSRSGKPETRNLKPETGVVVISGTGSIAYGRKSDGTSARAGGLGPDQGDEGSGYWIGKEWLKKRPSAPAATVRQIAALAPGIIRKAQKGNPAAREIIFAAQNHLAALVVELARSLSWKGPLPIAVGGSVLENPSFQRGFLKVLRQNKIDFRLVRKKTDQAVAPLFSPPPRGRTAGS